MARSLLVHARLPDTFMFHALAHASRIFNVLPVRGLYDEQGNVATPYLLFLGNKPQINHFRIFGCPVVARKWSTTQSSSGKQTERGVRGIFIGFDTNQKGYLFYSPGSRQIYISGDMLFDESFGTAIATTWQMHQDSLTLRPSQSDIPTIDATIEQTGAIDNFLSIAEEGSNSNTINKDPLDDTTSSSDNNSHTSDIANTNDWDDDNDGNVIPNFETMLEEFDDVSPQPITTAPLRRSNRTHKPNPRYAYHTQQYEWTHSANSHNLDLCLACASEAVPSQIIKGGDAQSWEPAPRTIRDILKMPEGEVRHEWLKSVKKELKALIDAKTFINNTMKNGEKSTPVMEIFKVKIQSDGSLDKLKTRMVVRGDLQDKSISEDKWSPTASFRSLKMFLAHASHLKVRVRQLDFIGAFLQAKMRTRMFVTIPQIYGILFPEYAEFCGKPVRLLMSMYGTTLCGKYWYLDLLDFLKEIGFKEGNCVKCFLLKRFPMDPSYTY
jgi:hypothetical protein